MRALFGTVVLVDILLSELTCNFTYRKYRGRASKTALEPVSVVTMRRLGSVYSSRGVDSVGLSTKQHNLTFCDATNSTCFQQYELDRSNSGGKLACS